MNKCLLTLIALLGVASPFTWAAEIPTFTLAKGDVTEGVIRIDETGRTRLELVFTPKKQAEFTSFTTEHVGHAIRLVVAGKVASEPKVNEIIRGRSMEFPAESPEEAVRMVRAVINKP